MDDENTKTEEDAVAFIRAHKREIIEQFSPEGRHSPAHQPISLFMAGSPGAGKTEVSKSLLEEFVNEPIRIDGDEIRMLCEGYTGTNAHLFQKAANKGVNYLYTYALDRQLNCILDGTFAYGGVEENILRSLNRRRAVEIWLVYQDPLKAWEFTKERERTESRHVPKEVFIRSFFESRNNACLVKEKFGSQVELNLLMKDYVTGREELKLNLLGNELDPAIGDHYTQEDLNRMLL